MSILPDGQEIPSSNGGKYLNKFPEGQTRFRILESPVTPFVEAWKSTEDSRKPVRVRVGKEGLQKALEQLKEIGYEETDKFGEQKPRYLWACKVYHYNNPAKASDGGEVKILSFHQKNIMNTLESNSQTEDWSDVTSYDIIVRREGSDMSSKYAVTNCVPKPLPKEAEEAIMEEKVDWDKYIASDDPWVSIGDYDQENPF
jgi:hypothetical protein